MESLLPTKVVSNLAEPLTTVFVMITPALVKLWRVSDVALQCSFRHVPCLSALGLRHAELVPCNLRNAYTLLVAKWVNFFE